MAANISGEADPRLEKTEADGQDFLAPTTDSTSSLLISFAPKRR
jgi:hypothetical protein